MNFSIILDNYQLFLSGLWTTVELIGLSIIFGFCIALPLALIRHLKIKYLDQAIWVFTYSFRSTPLLLQIFIIYYGIAQFDFIRNSFFWIFFKEAYFCAILAYTLNTAAYTAEILKGSFDNMSKREVEAAKAFGMSKRTIYTRIIIPNSLRRALPPYSNEVIFLLHSSAVASVITISELTGAASALYARYYDPFTPYIFVALIYMSLVAIISFTFKLLEKKYLAHLNRKGTGQQVVGNPI